MRVFLFSLVVMVSLLSACDDNEHKDIAGEYLSFNKDIDVVIKADGTIIISSDQTKFRGKITRKQATLIAGANGEEVAHLYVNTDGSLYGKIKGLDVRLMKEKQ